MSRKGYRKYKENLIGEYTDNCYGCIYKITNLINGKIYIGQTSIPIYRRMRLHITDSRTKQYPLAKAIFKYGFKNFKFEQIYLAENFNDLNEKETYFIKKYDSINRKIGYNVQTGGVYHTGIIHSDETIKLQRQKLLNLKGVIGAQKSRGQFIASIKINGKVYNVGGVKTLIDAIDVYDSMSKYYLKENAVLNNPDRFNPPLSVNDCRKYIKYLNSGTHYNYVGRLGNKYFVGLRGVALKFNNQVDAAYIADYINRKYNIDENSLNFINITLNKDEIIEILERNKSKTNKKVNYEKL